MRRSLQLSLIVVTILLVAGADVGVAQRGIRFGSGTATGPVPEPKDVFGFAPGDDYKLASHEQILDYFAKLDASSDRISVERIGKSSEGREMIVAVISSELNLKNRARYQDIARRLSLARG